MVAKVYVNNVQVGFIPIEQYEKIKKDAYKNKANYLFQIFNFIKISMNLMVRVIQYMPVFWFVILLGCILFSPNEVTALIEFFKEATSERITQFIRDMVTIGLIFGMVFVVMETILLMQKFGYENIFYKSIAENVLQLLEVAERGNFFIKIEK